MSEAPKRRETILNLNTTDEARAQAAVYLENHAELRDAVLQSSSAMEVRKCIWEHFGITTDLNPDPAPHITELQRAVLVESVDQWNQRRILGEGK